MIILAANIDFIRLGSKLSLNFFSIYSPSLKYSKTLYQALCRYPNRIHRHDSCGAQDIFSDKLALHELEYH